jgi:hypothetical protein
VKEILAVFTKNDKRIGISSLGDRGEDVRKQLNELINKNGCNICVTACRSRGGTHDAIFQFAEYADKFIEKTVDYTEDAVIQENTNQQDAQRLFEEIDKLI